MQKWLRESELNELKSFKCLGDKAATIPTFEELIQFCQKHKVKMVCEIKNPQLYPSGELENKVLDTIDKYQAFEDTVLIESFDFDALSIVHKRNPNFKIGALFLKPFNYKPIPSFATYVCPMAESVFINPWILFNTKQQGKKIVLWFAFFEAFLLPFFVFLGVDGVIIDDPRLLKQR